MPAWSLFCPSRFPPVLFHKLKAFFFISSSFSPHLLFLRRRCRGRRRRHSCCPPPLLPCLVFLILSLCRCCCYIYSDEEKDCVVQAVAASCFFLFFFFLWFYASERFPYWVPFFLLLLKQPACPSCTLVHGHVQFLYLHINCCARAHLQIHTVQFLSPHLGMSLPTNLSRHFFFFFPSWSCGGGCKNVVD